MAIDTEPIGATRPASLPALITDAEGRPRRNFYQRHEGLILGGGAVAIVMALWQAAWSAGEERGRTLHRPFHQVLHRHERLDLRGSLVDRGDEAVAHEAADVVLVDDAVSAMHLQREPADPDGAFGAVPLHEGRELADVPRLWDVSRGEPVPNTLPKIRQWRERSVVLGPDAAWYEATRAVPPRPSRPRAVARAVSFGCPFDCGPCTSHTQDVRLPVVTITSACNLDCPICYVHNKNDDAYHMPVEDFDADDQYECSRSCRFYAVHG